MDFTIVGRISSYVKTKNLTFAAKHKIRTGQTLTNSNGNFVSITTSTFEKMRESAKTSSDKAKQAKLRRIKQKLMNGRRISEEEMGFLRVNDTKLYKKAKHAEESREELKAELKKAKSKSEAREAMTRAMIKASTEAMAELGTLGQCNGNLGGMPTGGESQTTDATGAIFNAGASNSSTNVTQNSGAENQTLGEVNQSIPNSGEKATGEVSESTHEEINGKHDADKKTDNVDKNFAAQKNSDAEKNTPEDILEKYIMTIRALEDEWATFTKSDEYKNLPENTLDEITIGGRKKVYKQVEPPKRKFLDAVAVYRRSMLYSLES